MINCRIVEKNASTLVRLSRLLGKKPDIRLLGTDSKLIDAQKVIESESGMMPYILFVGLQKGDKDGIEFCQQYRGHKALIIIGSGDHLYKEAFMLKANAYLPRVIRIEDLNNAIEQALTSLRIDHDKGNSLQNKVLVEIAPKCNAVVDINNIIYIEFSQKKTVFHLAYRQEIESFARTMECIEAITSKYRFIRINEYCIINFEYLTSYGNKSVLMSDFTSLPLDAKYKSDVVQMFKFSNWNQFP